MAGKLQWNGDKARAQILAEVTRRVRACCILVMNEAKQLVSVAGTGQIVKDGLTDEYKTALKARKSLRLRRKLNKLKRAGKRLKKNATKAAKKTRKAIGKTFKSAKKSLGFKRRRRKKS